MRKVRTKKPVVAKLKVQMLYSIYSRNKIVIEDNEDIEKKPIDFLSRSRNELIELITSNNHESIEEP